MNEKDSTLGPGSAPLSDERRARSKIAHRPSLENPRPLHPADGLLTSVHALERERDALDQAVLATPDIAPYCSGSDWALAAHLGLHQSRELRIRREGAHWLTFARGSLSPFPTVLQPLELAWCYACPLLGPDREASLDLLERQVAGQWEPGHALILGGLPAGKGLREELVRRFSHCEMQLYTLTPCSQASLEGGRDGYLSRRSSKFRAALRKSEREAADVLEFEGQDVESDPEEVFRGLLDVERRSWKDAAGESLFQSEDYHQFYRQLCHYGSQRGRLRVVFAKREGERVAYCLGGVLGDTYRGFQMSFDREYASLGLGNLVQWKMIERLCDEGVKTYDLGMEIEYKRRWAEDRLELEALLIVAG